MPDHAESGQPPRATQRRSLETRDRLVEAALYEFAEKGFDGASTRAIAARAGVAQSAVPYHFTTKEALWKAAVDRIFGLYRERFAARRAGLEGVDTVTRARLLMVDQVRFSAAHPELHRLMVQEGARDSDRLAWLVDRHIARLVAHLRRMLTELEEAGHDLPGRPDHLFYMLIGASATPYALAAEFQRTMGEDPLQKSMIDAHAEAVVRVFFPSLFEERSALQGESQ